jgi:hypothetical protein
MSNEAVDLHAVIVAALTVVVLIPAARISEVMRDLG